MNLTAIRVSVLCLVSLLAGLASTADAGSPVAGPLEVQVDSATQSVAPGGLVHVDVAVFNHATRMTIEVELRTTVVYADGKSQILLLDSPIVLGPGEGFVQGVFFAASEDATPGPATFVAAALVTEVSGGNPNRLERPVIARDEDSFEVMTSSAFTTPWRTGTNTQTVPPAPLSQVRAEAGRRQGWRASADVAVLNSNKREESCDALLPMWSPSRPLCGVYRLCSGGC